MSWFNPDGLLLKFGTEKATATTGGEYRNVGQLHEVELKLTLSGLVTAPSIVNDVFFIPKNARIVEVETLTDTAAASGGTSKLNVGLVKTDRTTEVDFDGFIAAMDKTIVDTAGEKTVLNVGSSSAGALIGTTTTSPAYVCADYDTTAFTSGIVYVKIRYYMT